MLVVVSRLDRVVKILKVGIFFYFVGRGGALGYSRYSRIPTFFQTIFNAFNMFQNPNPDKILFLSIQFHYKAGECSLKKINDP